VIIIQMKGAEISSSDNASFGTITSMGNAGKYEKAVITAVNANTIEFEGTLLNNYTPSGIVQLVTMPVYEDVEVIGELTAQPWNGSTGGIVAFESTGNLIISDDIRVVGLGFRGGVSETISPNDCSWIFNQNNYFYDSNNWRGAMKGEGIAEFIAGKEAGRGPQANGGGGGNDHNSGGGGGANVGSGGQGGENDEPSTFGCDGEFPGLGGRGVAADTSRIFFGGGGGAGHSNNGVGTNGGNGGGIIIIEGNSIQMNGNIEVDGDRVLTTNGDGGGGGGAGGTLLLYANDFSISSPIGISTAGGFGGSTDSNNSNRCFGPGGGGSGGRVLTNLNLGIVPPTGANPGKVLNSTGSCNNTSSNATGGDHSMIVEALGIPKGEGSANLNIVQQPISQQSCLGADVVFTSAIGGADLDYQWQVNTGSGFQNIIDGIAYSGTTSSELTVFNVSLSHNTHVYRLVVDNVCTSMMLTDVVMIEIYDFPIITSQAQSINLCMGESTSFTIEVSGSGLNYQWQTMESGSWMNLSNTAIINGVNTASLNVTADQSLEGGASFRCLITDDCDQEILSDWIQLGMLSAASANATFVTNGLGVDFTNLSEEANSFQWNFGDGFSAIDLNPSHLYANEGTYLVELIAFSAACGADTFEMEVVLDLGMAPLANFTATNTNACAPASIQFINSSSPNAESFQWSFPGGNPSSSTMENPLVTYNLSGNYEVSLVATNAAGSDMIALPNYILINDVPDASFTSGVLGMMVEFSNWSTNATSYSWTFGDGGTSSEVDPSYTYSNAGNYTVMLTAINDCGEMTFTEVIEIMAAPIADFESNVTEGCAPLTVQFTDNSSTTTDSWNWTFLGGNPSTSTAQNPLVEYAIAGTYDVALEVANPSGNNTTNQSAFIQVIDGPTASFSFLVNGQSVDFTNLSSNGNTMTWEFGDGSISNSLNPSHTYLPGTYNVRLIVENDCGSDIFMTTIEIEEEVILNASFSSDLITACAPFVINYEDFSSGDISSWNWSFPGGTPSSSTAQNPSIYYNDPGVYEVSLEVGNGLTTDQITDEEYLTLVVPPTADFEYMLEGNKLKLINNSVNANFYEWNFGNGSSNSNEENPVKYFWATGIYTVSLFASNEYCGSIIAEDISILVTNTHQLNDELTVDLFPNPVKDLLQVEFSQILEQDLYLKVWSSNGQLIQQKRLSANDTFEVDMSKYSSGLYLIQLIGEEGNLIERVLKE